MKELYSNLWGSLGEWIQSWLAPGVMGVAFFAFALLPQVEDSAPWSGLAEVEGTAAGLLFAFATLVVSVGLATTSRPLLRFLEGYTLRPARLRTKLLASQVRDRRDLIARIEAAEDREDKLELREQLAAFPAREEWVLATRLGNSLRAGETYGWHRWGIATVNLWTRLTAVVDDKVIQQLNQSRAVIDFFVALIAVAFALSGVSVVAAVTADEWQLLAWIPVLAGLTPLLYDRAVAASAWYATGMQALVDLGRVPLAEALGLTIPDSLEKEKAMWRALSDYISWGPGWGNSTEWVEVLDQHRLHDDPDSKPDARTSADGWAPGVGSTQQRPRNRVIEWVRSRLCGGSGL